MRQVVLDELRARYGFGCGYCGVTEADIGAKLTTDHFLPRSRGGSDDPDNLVYCCFACNTYKGDFWSADPNERLLHPLVDDVSAHFTQSPNGKLMELTASGRLHIANLQLNRPELMAYRLARQTQREVTETLRDSLNELESLRQRVAELEAAVAAAERRFRP